MEANSDEEKLEVDLKDTSILLDMSKLFNNEELSDVILVVGDKKFYSHRLMLAKSSSDFKTMLYGKHWPESAEEEVTLKETQECEAVFDLFIKYLYTAEVTINVETTIGILSLADKYDVMSLKHVYLKAIMLNTESLIKSTIWVDLDIDCLEELLSSSELVIHHVASLKENSERLLPLIRFSQVPVKELSKVEKSELANQKESSGILHEMLGRAFRFKSLCPVNDLFDFSDTFYMPRDYLSRKVCEWKTPPQRDRRGYSIPQKLLFKPSDKKCDVEVDFGPVVSCVKTLLWDISLTGTGNSLTLSLSAKSCLEIPIQVILLVTDVKNRVIQSERSPIEECQKGSEVTVNAVISHPEQARNAIILMKVDLTPSPTPSE